MSCFVFAFFSLVEIRMIDSSRVSSLKRLLGCFVFLLFVFFLVELPKSSQTLTSLGLPFTDETELKKRSTGFLLSCISSCKMTQPPTFLRKPPLVFPSPLSLCSASHQLTSFLSPRCVMLGEAPYGNLASEGPPCSSAHQSACMPLCLTVLCPALFMFLSSKAE